MNALMHDFENGMKENQLASYLASEVAGFACFNAGDAA